jgi:oligoribonuclease NrnB/cAMP/cGMP phosphodiesterase (DHH superfamily)
MLIVTHKDCFDGLVSAFIAHNALIEEHPDLRIVPMYYSTPATVPEYTPGETIYILDFSYSGHLLVEHFKDAGKVVVIDHHHDVIVEILDYFAEHELPANVELIFDTARSGAGLTWDYFNAGKTPPKWVMHAQDYDLYQFKDPGTRAFMQSFGLIEQTIEGVAEFIKQDYLSILSNGQVLIRKQQAMVAHHLKSDMTIIEWEGYTIPCLNVPRYITSAVGEALSGDYPFAMMYFDRGDGVRHFSLRSKKGGVDVSALAKRYGGKGHPSAAGFDVKTHNLFA